jgi:ADP-dependent NAD(P)H-hydrate dehydratase / NAD(P)H-hydrate epimerase
MKLLTAEEMRQVDQRTIAAGTPGIVLMENAAHRVVEFLARKFAPLNAQRIVVVCGKGNNGGDGMAVARQIHTRFPAAALRVALLADPAELKGDAAANYRMLQACGCLVEHQITAQARDATLVVDALLGTGVSGPAAGRALEGIREINDGFPRATVVAVDIPSGMPSDSGEPVGEIATADYTVTFTAPKVGQALPPNCDHVGELIVAPIGSPAELYAQVQLELLDPAMFRGLLAPRQPSGHKGTYGHALIVAGSRGKTGAAAMCGMGALRAGAGLVTVASEEGALAAIGSHAPELMTEPLEHFDRIAENMTVIAMGPGLGPNMQLVRGATRRCVQPMVLDADALVDGIHGEGRVRVLTPHPGEMARISGKSVAEIQKDRVRTAREFALERGLTLVLKGQRTVIAFADGRAWINPTGTPAMGTGGTGDVLTGMIAGFLAQFPRQPDEAVAAAVYLHGLAGQMGARALGEKCLIATDILKYLPAAMKECALEACANVPDSV